MALFSRANSNILSLLNHCYCKKFTIGTARLKSRGRMSTSTVTQHKNNKRITESTLEAEITKRRSQACRSLLIEVYSSKSYNDLHNYCSRFGDILSMHHYQLNNHHQHKNYILLEFKDTISVNEIMLSASFANKDYIAPVKSSLLWFRKGQSIGLQKNNQKKMVLSIENGYTLPTEKQIANLLYNERSISGQITVLYEALKLTDLEIRLRFHTARHLEQYFSGLFQNMRILPFGSSINGFGRKRCDLDLVLVPDDSEELKATRRLVFQSKSMKHSDRNDTKMFLGILANAMQHFIPGISNVRRVLEARVPIIQFRYDYTHIECDLSATNMTAVYMSELLYLYGEIDWRVRPLVTVIRVWAKNQKVTSNTPGQWITNFPLTLLVLFYLQQKKILPSLNTLKFYATHGDVRHAETGINCTFLRDIKKLPPDYKYKSNQDSLEALLHGFFEYYSTFDFYTNGICIREGKKILKPSSSALHITNPLEITLNVCKNVTLHEVNHITSKARDAIYALETDDKSRSNGWGIMTLLKINYTNAVNLGKTFSLDEPSIKDHSENGSYEVTDKFEISEVSEPITNKEKEIYPNK